MITIVHADDWMAVYDGDGDCVYQDHSIEPERLLELAGIPFESLWAQDQADEDGCFPASLGDVRPDDEPEPT